MICEYNERSAKISLTHRFPNFYGLPYYKKKTGDLSNYKCHREKTIIFGVPPLVH